MKKNKIKEGDTVVFLGISIDQMEDLEIPAHFANSLKVGGTYLVDTIKGTSIRLRNQINKLNLWIPVECFVLESKYKPTKSFLISLSVEEAKELLDNPILRPIIEEYYTPNELGLIRPPSSDEVFVLEEGGWYIDTDSDISRTGTSFKLGESINYNICPKKTQAETVLALTRLYQLMSHPYYKDDCDIDYRTSEEVFIIYLNHDRELDVTSCPSEFETILAFKTKEKAERFLTDHKPLIEKIKRFL